MTYEAYELRNEYRNDPPAYAALIGKTVKVGMYRQSEDEEDILLASVSGTLVGVTVATEAFPGGGREAVLLEGDGNALTAAAQEGTYLMVSGPVEVEYIGVY